MPPCSSISSLISHCTCFRAESREQSPLCVTPSSCSPSVATPCPRLSVYQRHTPGRPQRCYLGLAFQGPGCFRNCKCLWLKPAGLIWAQVATILKEITVCWVSFTPQVQERKHSQVKKEQRRKGKGKQAGLGGFGPSAQARPAAFYTQKPTPSLTSTCLSGQMQLLEIIGKPLENPYALDSWDWGYPLQGPDRLWLKSWTGREECLGSWGTREEPFIIPGDPQLLKLSATLLFLGNCLCALTSSYETEC